MASLKDLDKAVDDAMDAFEAHNKQMERYIKDYSPGVRRPDALEFFQFIQALRQKSPREEFIFPDGEVYFESPAVLLMAFGENTKEDWRRYKQLGIREH